MDEVNNLKAKYAHQIEDGRKIEVFTSTPEWQWYVEHVLQPTIQLNTKRILDGSLDTDKEDWITRGIVQGLQIVIDGTTGVVNTAKRARELAKELQKELENE